jgi:hypothetical protein
MLHVHAPLLITNHRRIYTHTFNRSIDPIDQLSQPPPQSLQHEVEVLTHRPHRRQLPCQSSPRDFFHRRCSFLITYQRTHAMNHKPPPTVQQNDQMRPSTSFPKTSIISNPIAAPIPPPCVPPLLTKLHISYNKHTGSTSSTASPVAAAPPPPKARVPVAAAL